MEEKEDRRRAEGSLGKPCPFLPKFLPARPPELNSAIGIESPDGRQ